MKAIIFIFLLAALASCTDVTQAETWVECPCFVESIESSINSGYRIKIVDEFNRSITFNTNYYHHLGDTIK